MEMNLRFSSNIGLISCFLITCPNISGQKSERERDGRWYDRAEYGRRQQAANTTADSGPEGFVPGHKGDGANQAQRYTTPTTKVTKKVRTTPKKISLLGDCDYIAKYCLKAYITGKLCARTLYYKYYTFENYCIMDYVNCMERYDVWQVVHMGPCYSIQRLSDYKLYPYNDDYFLDSYYVLEH